MLMQKLLSGGEESKLYSDDVFSAYLRTGTGADVTVTTGIDMTKGYMLWSKGRSGATDHAIYDSARGVTLDLASNTTAAQTTQSTGLKVVSATGHTIGSLAKMNTSAATYVDFVFRKAPKFFDVVTFTTGAGGSVSFSHSLGQVPGMVIFKSTGVLGDWITWHRSLGNTNYVRLNTTNAEANTGWDASNFAAGTVNLTGGRLSGNSGETYVAYLLAHDTSADGIIQCGSYTGNGSTAGPEITLGWEPQYLLIKKATDVGGWMVIDSARGMVVGATGTVSLQANLTITEAVANHLSPTSTGFKLISANNNFNTASSTYIFLAIRRPNKPPTSGTQVFSANASSATTGTVVTTGFPVDLQISNARVGASNNSTVVDRLRGVSTTSTEVGNYLSTSQTIAETSASLLSRNFSSTGFSVPGYFNGTPTIYWNFKRAPGFFDVVCYTGTGLGAQLANHSLGVIPELMILKSRSNVQAWFVYHAATGNTSALGLNSTAIAEVSVGYWNNTTPTSTAFTLSSVAGYGNNLVAYLFASLPGISKVGSYTGNGSSQTINCGFAAGARFILIKRTDSTGDWYVWDSARGIVAANDPHLSLNTTAAEVTTDDSVDPDNSGFIVNQVAATNINVTSASYIFLAIA